MHFFRRRCPFTTSIDLLLSFFFGRKNNLFDEINDLVAPSLYDMAQGTGTIMEQTETKENETKTEYHEPTNKS